MSPVTRQFVDYLNSTALIIEVWGSQTVMKPPGAADNPGNRIVSNVTIEKVETELRLYKQRGDSLEKKIQVI